MLTIGQRYSRQDIHDDLGGELDSYLPQRGGRIVCGCFNLDTNPDAPTVILAGDGPQIMNKAQQLCAQGGTIPVFIKRDTNLWESMGDYTVVRCSTTPTDIQFR